MGLRCDGRTAMPPASAPAAMPTKPIAALSVAGYGSLLGSMFPVMAIMTVSDIGGGLSAAADAAALVNTIQNVGAVAGIVIAPAFAAARGRGPPDQGTGTGRWEEAREGKGGGGT